MKMSPRQKGFAPVLIVVIIAAIAAVAYFAFRQSGGGLSIPGTSLTPRATEKDFEFIQDATLRKHFVAQANQTTYRTKTYSDAADLTFIMEVALKGEDFNTRDIEQTTGGKETKHRIVLGETTYVKDYSDNTWWKQTITPEELDQENQPEEPTDFKEEYSQPDLQFKALGQEACGNLTCYKYQQTGGGPEGIAFTRTFWFDTQKFLLHKEEAAVGEFTTSTEYSYDNINITAPSPTKDVPAGGNIYDYYYGTTSPTTPINYSDYQAPTQQELEDLQNFQLPEDTGEIGY